MPDTSPLSTVRKLVALGVLAGLLAVSLGAARLVMLRGKRAAESNKAIITYTLDPHLQLKADGDQATDGVIYALESADRHRQGVVYVEKIPQGRSIADLAAQVFESDTGQEPAAMNEFAFGGYAGVELQDVRALAHHFAVMRVVAAGDQMVGVLWQGDTAYSAKDRDALTGLMNGFMIKKAR